MQAIQRNILCHIHRSPHNNYSVYMSINLAQYEFKYRQLHPFKSITKPMLLISVKPDSVWFVLH